MRKMPLLSSKELVRMLEKGDVAFVRQGALIMQYTTGWWRVNDFLLLSRWGRRHWMLSIAKEFYGS